jgi:exoribonuclease R
LIEDVLYKEERGGAACYQREELQVIADHLNHMEVRVDAASFESHRLQDLQHYDGARRTYTGKILSFMRGRVAVKLHQTDLLVQVRYRDFKQDKMMPISINDEFTDRYFTLGEEVNVRTEGVDWSSKSINARIVR